MRNTNTTSTSSTSHERGSPDDDVPEIDHADPIHYTPRERTLDVNACPSYDVLIQSVDQLNRSLFTLVECVDDETRRDVDARLDRAEKRRNAASNK